MSFNRVKLFNEIANLREKTLVGASLIEMLTRTKTMAKSLGDEEMITWIESETKTAEGVFYQLDKKERTEIFKIAPYRSVRAKYSLPSFPDLGKEEQLKIAVLLSYLQKRRAYYFCTTPIGVLENNQNSGIEVSLPDEYSKRILRGINKIESSQQDKTVATFVFNSVCLFIPPESIREILDGVRGKLIDYLDRIIQNQPLNIIDVFYKSMDHVYNDIKKLYPDIAGEFDTIHMNITQDKPENFSNVASACRRVLKKFADTEYPSSMATTLDGHSLADDKFKNRIIEWIKKRTKSASQAELFSAHIDLLAEYLDSLYNLASKGDKNPITKDEAELCSIHTYFIMAELIRIKQS